MAAGLWLVSTRGVAQQTETSTTNQTSNLADLSIEQLMNESVTSVSKKATRLNQSPAAVTVITQDEIRRLGITTLPEALRLVPGMDVAQIDAHDWAVSARGFNSQFANKLLVMIDGRSVYSSGFGGVIWSMQDVVMEDLDHIEVIRGPGSTLWGANAVNGVINIITKSARETQGLLVTVDGGTEDQPATTVRYGGKLASDLYYRAYVKYFNRDGLVLADGQDAPDPWSGLQGGMRMDWEPSPQDRFSLSGDYFAHRAEVDQQVPLLLPPYAVQQQDVNHDLGGNLLGRWAHSFSDSSGLNLQAYYDYSRPEQLGASYTANTIDLDAEHHFDLGERDDVVWGLGYRYIADHLEPSPVLEFVPASRQVQLFSAFAQDEFALVPERLKFIAGTKLEHNDYTGFEVEPSARLLWTPTERQTVWAAVSRAVRTPARNELDERVNLTVIPPAGPNPPTLVSVLGNPNLEAEELLAYELGYRVELSRRVSVDVAGFYNDYHDLVVGVSGTPTFDPAPPTPHAVAPVVNHNAVVGDTYGVEVSARYDVTEAWHLMAGYSWLGTAPGLDSQLSQAFPQQQAQLRSQLDLPMHLELNGAVYFVDQCLAPAITGEQLIPSYVRLDIGLVWHPAPCLELGIWGQNLLDDRHVEFPSATTTVLTEIPRSVLAKITWRF